MFSDIKLIAETAVSVFKTLAGQQKHEWKQLGELFEKIAESLDSMAAKYTEGAVPRTEFVSLQVYADELRSCGGNLPLSGNSEETKKWIALLEDMITTADGVDAAYYGFKSVPGPFYSRKEGEIPRAEGDQIEIPEIHEIRDASAAFRAASNILNTRGA